MNQDQLPQKDAKTNVIIFSEIEWGFLKQRHQLLAEYLANEGHMVTFVQKVPSRIPSLRVFIHFIINFLRNNQSAITSKKSSTPDRVTLKLSAFLPQTNFLFRAYNKFIASAYYSALLRNGVAYIFSPSAVELVKHKSTKNYKVIFDIIHNWWELPWNTQTLSEAATYLIKKADNVICDSSPLANDLEKKHRRAIITVPPGVTEQWLNLAFSDSKYSILPRKETPRVVFFGNLRENSDTELLFELAAQGIQVDAYGTVTQSVLEQLGTNVNFFLPQTQSQLVCVVKQYDFVLLPYRNDAFSKWISPAKYFEVLALGKPILSRSKLYHLPGWEKLCFSLDLSRSAHPMSLRDRLTKIGQDYYQQDLDELSMKIATENTWSMRFSVIEKVIADGFNFGKIKNIDKDSSGNKTI